MSAVHFHLVFTHGLVALVVIGALVLAWSLLRRNHEVRTTGLGLLVLAGLLAIPVYLTGEPAEEVAEGLQISHDVIHEHEEAAELTFIGLEILGAAALAALLVGARRKSVGNSIAGTVLVVAVVVGGLIVRTASLGGEIRHTEIRAGGAASGGNAGGAEHGEEAEESH